MQSPQFFSNGNFVIHKIAGNWKGTCSAWYDKNGILLDAEQHLTYNRTNSIKRDGPIWKRLERIGKVFINSNTYSTS